jgi:hypothetical protein
MITLPRTKHSQSHSHTQVEDFKVKDPQALLSAKGCVIVAAPVYTPSRAPLLLPLPLSHNPAPSTLRSLVRDGDRSTQALARLSLSEVSRSTSPPLFPSPHANSFVICTTASINTQSSRNARCSTLDKPKQLRLHKPVYNRRGNRYGKARA